jgi:hypothetical protein
MRVVSQEDVHLVKELVFRVDLPTQKPERYETQKSCLFGSKTMGPIVAVYPQPSRCEKSQAIC